MFKKLFILFLIIIIFATGCTETITNSPDFGNTTKNVIIWAFPDGADSLYIPLRENEVNEYLDFLGFDFNIKFLSVKSELGISFTQQIEKKLQNKEQIDIITALGTFPGEEAGINAYHRYIHNGWFIPLDEYFETEIGKNLFEIMPEKHWEGLRVNGAIYGINGSAETLSLSSKTGFLINTELMKKYEFDENIFVNPNIELLLEIVNNEDCIGVDTSADFSPVISASTVTEGVYWDEEAQMAKSVLENDEYINKLKFYYDLYQNKLASNMVMEYGEKFLAREWVFSDGTMFTFENIIFPMGSYAGVELTPVIINDPVITQAKAATGIYKGSEHKNQAFELIALVQTDKYLNNLLLFGIEGMDYDLVDGKVTFDNYKLYPNNMNFNRFGNSAIRYPFSFEPVNMSEYYKNAYEKAKVPKDIGFAFDGRGVEEQTKNLITVFDEVSTAVFSNEYPDFNELIKKMYILFEEAGIQDIINESNKQYKKLMKN